MPAAPVIALRVARRTYRKPPRFHPQEYFEQHLVNLVHSVNKLPLCQAPRLVACLNLKYAHKKLSIVRLNPPVNGTLGSHPSWRTLDMSGQFLVILLVR